MPRLSVIFGWDLKLKTFFHVWNADYKLLHAANIRNFKSFYVTFLIKFMSKGLHVSAGY